MTRNEELKQDIHIIGNYIEVESDERTVEGLQKLIILLESWKEAT